MSNISTLLRTQLGQKLNSHIIYFNTDTENEWVGQKINCMAWPHSWKLE